MTIITIPATLGRGRAAWARTAFGTSGEQVG